MSFPALIIVRTLCLAPVVPMTWFSIKEMKKDMILDACADIHVPVLRATVAEKDPEQKDKQLRFIAKYTLPEVLHGLHAHIGGGDGDAKKNKGPFFLGEHISVADIAAFDVLTNALLPKQKDLLPIDYARDFPKLLEHVGNVPSIAEYMRVRSKHETMF